MQQIHTIFQLSQLKAGDKIHITCDGQNLKKVFSGEYEAVQYIDCIMLNSSNNSILLTRLIQFYLQGFLTIDSIVANVKKITSLEIIRTEYELDILGYDCECRLIDIIEESEPYQFERNWVWKHRDSGKRIVVYDICNTHCCYDSNLTNLINEKNESVK